MANRVCEVYCDYLEDLDREMREAMDHKTCPLCCKRYELSVTREDSKALNTRRGPLIVIAGSGMATGGRILHHFAQRLPLPRTTVLLVGFQAAGTRGRALTPTLADGFDNSNPLRVESAEQAAILDPRIAAAWSSHSRRVEVPSTTDFLQKARVVLQLVRAELPECCHGHDIDVTRP